MDNVILDHTDSIQLNISNPPISNLHALNYLPSGLFNLAATVKVEEGKRVQRDRNAKVLEVFGHIPFIIPCAFHWFSTSLTNFVRLIGLIDLMNKNKWKTEDLVKDKNRSDIKQGCSNYAKVVIPEIYTWRNKVSAHFSPTDPFKNDNLATLEESVMNSIAYHTPRFRVGYLKWHTQGDSSQLPQWSLTETYEKLSSRFWPKSRIAYDQKECVPPEPFSFVPERKI